MTSKKKWNIGERAINAAEEALHKNQYVTAIDVFMGMGLLQPVHVQDWRKGKIQYLENIIQGSLGKISRTMKTFRVWAARKELNPRETVYLAYGRGPKRELQFSKSGHPTIEKFYRTHYISPSLSEKKQMKILEKQEKPEIVVFSIIRDSQCSQCKKELLKGNLLFMEKDNPLCLNCAKLDHLFFLPSGDATITRRAKKHSNTFAIVLRYSRTRNRYERQGLLVEKEAMERVGADDTVIAR